MPYLWRFMMDTHNILGYSQRTLTQRWVRGAGVLAAAKVILKFRSLFILRSIRAAVQADSWCQSS